MRNAVEIKKLNKKFGSIHAVKDVSFTVNQGEVLGFLGPNGAGKSTTMKMIACFLTPTSGTVNVSGYDIATNAIAVKKIIGYLPEGAPAYGEMSVQKFLEFIAEIRGIPAKKRKQRISELVEMIHLESVLQQTIETLSKGYKRRVGLAQTIMHNPDILIMDEPTDGLDPNQKHEVRKLIQDMAKDKAIIVSTHILEEVDAICTRAIIIASGRLLFDGTPQELRNKSTNQDIDEAFRILTQ